MGSIDFFTIVGENGSVMSSSKKRWFSKIIVILICLIILSPVVMVGLSFIGRIDPDSVFPDEFDVYVSVPDTARLAGNVLKHEALPDIMALAELAPLMPMFNQVRNSGVTESRLVRLLVGGRLKAALLPEGGMLAAWDTGIVSPLLRFLPTVAKRINVQGLFYVQAGGNSRFEYRLDNGSVFFIGYRRNLLIVSNNPALFGSAVQGGLQSGARGAGEGSHSKAFHSKNHDIALLLSPQTLLNIAESGDGTDAQMLSALKLLKFPGKIEVSLLIRADQLDFRLLSPLQTDNENLRKIIERNSRVTPLLSAISWDTQYMTMLAAGTLQELLDGVSAISRGTPAGLEADNALRRANSAARITLRMSLDELLFSWTGSQFAVFGLEGRPHPVFAVEISDEAKRKEVFDKVFRTAFVSENIRLNLDGNRIPRIQVPGFLNALLSLLGVDIPSPFYIVHNNYLFISESAESVLAAVNAVRRNEVLLRQDLWRSLSHGNTGPSSFLLFYSLDRSFPFFLRGNNEMTAILRLYHQGLVRVSMENSMLNVSLSVIPGPGGGIVPVAGYPLELVSSGRGVPGNRLFAVSPGRNPMLLVTRGKDVLAINPLDRSVRELQDFGAPNTTLYLNPQTPLRASANGEVWIADSFGHVNLTNRDLESISGFPISTGIRLSAAPGAFDGRLFLSSEDGSVYTVDNKGSVNWWGTFYSALRSPPSFLNFNNRTFVSVYPKDIIFGEIFILDDSGNALPNWPVRVDGVAFGSPLLFSAQYAGSRERLFAAFITQAGELTVYTDAAEVLPGFPLDLEGVFFLQPVFDGESLWVIESSGILYQVRLNGEVLSQIIPRFSVKDEGFIAVSDGEVFFTGEGNLLHGYSLNFNSLYGFPLPVWGRPVIGDIFGAGQREVAGVGMDNRLYMWQFR